MIIEQKLGETDLAEIEQVFSKSMEVKSPVITRIIKICDYLGILCICILFGYSIVGTIILGTISKEPVLWAIIGIIGDTTGIFQPPY